MFEKRQRKGSRLCAFIPDAEQKPRGAWWVVKNNRFVGLLRLGLCQGSNENSIFLAHPPLHNDAEREALAGFGCSLPAIAG